MNPGFHIVVTQNALRHGLAHPSGPPGSRPARSAPHGQIMYREQSLRIGPVRSGLEPGRARELLEFLDRIFVGVFGMYGFAGMKVETAAIERYTLRLETYQMHLDTSGPGIVKSVMAES